MGTADPVEKTEVENSVQGQGIVFKLLVNAALYLHCRPYIS